MLTIPDTGAEVTADWLSHVLDQPVRQVRLVDEHAGTTGRAVIELLCEGDSALPSRLFVKLPPTDALQREFVCSSGMGRREALFYQQLSTEMPVRVPRCYHADTNDSGDEYIMLLEHLEDSDCSFQNAGSRPAPAYRQEVLASFARLHAAYWNTDRFNSDLAWIEPPLQHEIAVHLIAQALEQHAADMPPVFRQMGELYLAEADAIHRLWHRGETTLIHGDVHDANLFYDGDEPGFLDWALVASGPAMRDVGYFLAGTLTPGEHLDAGRDLLRFYREQLLAGGVSAPSESDLWQQYQWHAAYVWVGATVTLAMGDAWQPINYVLATLENLHAGLESLGSVDAIRTAL